MPSSEGTRAGLLTAEERAEKVRTVIDVFSEQFPYLTRNLPAYTVAEAVVDRLFGDPEPSGVPVSGEAKR